MGAVIRNPLHEDAFLRPRLDARYRFSKGTLAGARGNGRDAPIPAVRQCGLQVVSRSELNSSAEERTLHMNVEPQIEAAACRVIKVEAAVSQMKVDPGARGVVDRAKHLPIAMSADAKPADIAIRGQPEPAGKKPAREVDMIAPGNQRIDAIDWARLNFLQQPAFTGRPFKLRQRRTQWLFDRK